MFNQSTDEQKEMIENEETEKTPIKDIIKLLLSAVALIIGVVMLILGIMSIKETVNTFFYKEIEVTVVEKYKDQDSYYAVKYEIDGKEYKSDCKIKGNVMVGSIESLYYDKNKPQNIVAEKEYKIGSSLLSIVGVIIIIFSTKWFFKLLKIVKSYYVEEEV